jgi:hypothetical protein
MDLDKLIDYWKDIPGVNRIKMANIVTFPKYCSPLHLYEHHIKEGQDKFFAYINSNFNKTSSDDYYVSDKLNVNGINNILTIKLTEDEWNSNDVIRSRMIEWINYCLVVRQNDENIFDLVPYLKEYKKNYDGRK